MDDVDEILVSLYKGATWSGEIQKHVLKYHNFSAD